MSITRGEIAGRILRLLNKTATFPAFYTPEKINDAIEEAMDFLAVKMFLAGEGWQDKIKYVDTDPGLETLPIPADMSMIKEVRFLWGGIYVPMVYDDANRTQQVDGRSGMIAGYVGTYRVIDNAFYFNPPIAYGGSKFLQIEYTTFPKRLNGDFDTIEGHFFKPFVHWVAYWCASRLTAGLGKPDPDWQSQEEMWLQQVEAVIVKRNMQTTVIREFNG